MLGGFEEHTRSTSSTTLSRWDGVSSGTLLASTEPLMGRVLSGTLLTSTEPIMGRVLLSILLTSSEHSLYNHTNVLSALYLQQQLTSIPNLLRGYHVLYISLNSTYDIIISGRVIFICFRSSTYQLVKHIRLSLLRWLNSTHHSKHIIVFNLGELFQILLALIAFWKVEHLYQSPLNVLQINDGSLVIYHLQSNKESLTTVKTTFVKDVL